MTSTVLHPRKTYKDFSWKLVFLASFCTASNIYLYFTDKEKEPIQSDMATPSMLGYCIGGLFVGFGTKLGNGCTSGHGICGMARFSKRSFAAVATFMATGVITGVLVSPYNKTFLSGITACLRETLPSIRVRYQWQGLVLTAASIVAALPNIVKKPKALGAAIAGGIFSIGLAVSQMIEPAKIQGFLDVAGISQGRYDPTLLTVMGSGVIVSWIGYQFVPNYSKVRKQEECMAHPLTCDEYSVPTNTTIDWKLITGSASFGVGWAIGALCPGPALFYAATGMVNVLWVWFPSYFVGAYAAESLVAYTDARSNQATYEAVSDE